MGGKGGRGSRRWRTLRSEILATHPPICTLCGKPIDYDAPPRTTWAPSVDHVIPVARGGSMWNPNNLRPAHYGCNSGKQHRTRKPRPQSQKW